MSVLHQAVMVNEVLAGLNVQPDGIYIDATFGRGGHTRAILAQLSSRGRVIAIDRDPSAVAFAKQQFAGEDRFQMMAGVFSGLLNMAESIGVMGQVNGILLDLGVSSPQLDEAERGFSFAKDGPLDMRMDPSCGLSAADWLQKVRLEELIRVLKQYGEERFARRIANAIVANRLEKPIRTTGQLAAIIGAAKPVWEKKIHPATKAFQAIRIAVNAELVELEAVLEQALSVLAKQGRLVVMSFQSLEDRMVKRFMRQQSRDDLPANLPVKNTELTVRMRRVGKAQKAKLNEVQHNPRARSAVLRVGEKLR